MGFFDWLRMAMGWWNAGGAGDKLCFGVTVNPALLGEIEIQPMLLGAVEINPCQS